jgi:hypothetical protein
MISPKPLTVSLVQLPGRCRVNSYILTAAIGSLVRDGTNNFTKVCTSMYMIQTLKRKELPKSAKNATARSERSVMVLENTIFRSSRKKLD